MPARSVNAITLARDINEFRSHLQWSAVGAYPSPDANPLADVCLALLDALEADMKPVTAVTAALTAWRSARERLGAAAEAGDIAAGNRFRRQEADDSLAITITCPYCAAAPGQRCRAACDPIRARPHAHLKRVRAASASSSGLPGDAEDALETAGIGLLQESVNPARIPV
jgi:hypothetical protein